MNIDVQSLLSGMDTSKVTRAQDVLRIAAQDSWCKRLLSSIAAEHSEHGVTYQFCWTLFTNLDKLQSPLVLTSFASEIW
jgi:hypothetical protein